MGIAGAIITLAFPYVILLRDNQSHIETAQSFCPFKMLTGFPCPGCGMTKSLVFLYEGDIWGSLYYHLFGPFIFICCVVAIVVLALELITEREYFNKILFNRKLGYFLGYTLIIYHLGRLVYFVSTNNLTDILQQSIWK